MEDLARLASIRQRLRNYSQPVLQGLLIIAALVLVNAYQTRNLLDTHRQPAPPLTGTTLQGAGYDLSQRVGRPALIYFFAPWCPYCSASADNLVRLRRLREQDKLEIVAVALDWESKEEVVSYARKHSLNVPVLLGDTAIATDWRVRGFPTYYVLDHKHRLVRRDFGYSTQFGLWWRTWLAE